MERIWEPAKKKRQIEEADKGCSRRTDARVASSVWRTRKACAGTERESSGARVGIDDQTRKAVRREDGATRGVKRGPDAERHAQGEREQRASNEQHGMMPQEGRVTIGPRTSHAQTRRKKKRKRKQTCKRKNARK